MRVRAHSTASLCFYQSVTCRVFLVDGGHQSLAAFSECCAIRQSLAKVAKRSRTSHKFGREISLRRQSKDPRRRCRSRLRNLGGKWHKSVTFPHSACAEPNASGPIPADRPTDEYVQLRVCVERRQATHLSRSRTTALGESNFSGVAAKYCPYHAGPSDDCVPLDLPARAPVMAITAPVAHAATVIHRSNGLRIPLALRLRT